MLAISLIFVGVTLILDGLFMLWKKNSKILIILNLFTASIIFIFNLYSIITAPAGTLLVGFVGGMLFGLTNLLIAFDFLFKTDTRGTGYYCLIATVIAMSLSVFYFVSGAILQGGAWAVWSMIWLFCFIGFALSKKFLPATYIMLVVQGIATTGAFGLLQLFQVVQF